MGHEGEDGLRIRALIDSTPHNDQGLLGLSQELKEAGLGLQEGLEGRRLGAEVLKLVVQFGGLPNEPNGLAAEPGLSETGVEDGGLVAGIGSNEEHGLGLFDAWGRGVEEVVGAEVCGARRETREALDVEVL